jgi:hypothetical protein
VNFSVGCLNQFVEQVAGGISDDQAAIATTVGQQVIELAAGDQALCQGDEMRPNIAAA